MSLAEIPTRLPASDLARHEQLSRTWGERPGFLGWFSATNHKIIGKRYIVTAFAFLVLGEHVEFRDLLGIIPVALGIYLVTRPAAALAPPVLRSNR